MKKVPIVIEILLSFMKSLRLLFLITVLPCLGAKSVSPEINALLQSLQKSLPANKSPQNDGTDYSLFVTNIRRVLDAGDYGTAERLLTAARPNLPGNASSVVDELLASIAQLRGEADAKSFSAITAIATEARMKMKVTLKMASGCKRFNSLDVHL